MLGKRLLKEIQGLEEGNKDEYIKLVSNPDNIYQWRGIIQAPTDSYYEGYYFNLSIDILSEYPLKPPVIKFITKIFHPNVAYDVSFIHSISIFIKISLFIMHNTL